jgi:hypothetical protein
VVGQAKEKSARSTDSQPCQGANDDGKVRGKERQKEKEKEKKKQRTRARSDAAPRLFWGCGQGVEDMPARNFNGRQF